MTAAVQGHTPVTVYPTIPTPSLVIPSARPATGDWCNDRTEADLSTYRCTRPLGHGGRHANVWHWYGGVVRAVWGVRPWTPPKREFAACGNCGRDNPLDAGLPYGTHVLDCGYCEQSSVIEHTDPRFP